MTSGSNRLENRYSSITGVHGLKSLLCDYRENAKRIRQSYNNPLKAPENLPLKDKLEQQFYDEEAQRHLDQFDTELFLYDPKEKLPPSHRYFYSHLTDVDGKSILDIGCGYGFTAVNLAKRGGKVTSIDISPKMVELARTNAQFNTVEDSVTVRRMSAQNMQFEADTFDYVVGIGILHHLNMHLAGKEIFRVLKPGGAACFLEPRIPFKWLIFIRSLFPNKCFESPGGSQLDDRDIALFQSCFTEYQTEYFMFLKKLARFPGLNGLGDRLDQIDAHLLQVAPWLWRLYWAVVIRVVK